jgi:hypothetical protein
MVIDFRGTPEADMVALLGAVSDGLLKRRVLRAIPKIEGAHRGMLIGLSKHHIGSDPE